ncbi:hypothetical protein UC8_28060 [Roseimaritima ulvae]|uniref:Uncharacterized protein n=1 Tax=Roseimaritima ulvae TaxID=980254 RepID=A0A5B9QP42_9BACT|nr:hypothetical protein UC8_28060 [Roseimaritima ulvae]
MMFMRLDRQQYSGLLSVREGNSHRCRVQTKWLARNTRKKAG